MQAIHSGSLIYAIESRIVTLSLSLLLRILFAQYFTAKMFENIIGYMHRLQFVHYHITVVHPDAKSYLLMQESMQYCAKSHGIVVSPAIDFIEANLTTYLRSIIDVKNSGKIGKGRQPERFDYIEYNGGLSKSSDYSTHLSLFAEVLKDDGIIGMTYFTKNIHERVIRQQIAAMNQTAFIPFSYEAKRLIKLYLEVHNMEFLSKDEELLIYLGGEPAQRRHPPSSLNDLVPPEHWNGFTREEVKSMLSTANLIDSAWMPTAYSHPYRK